MPFDFSSNVRDLAGWANVIPQSQTTSADLSAHVDGGHSSATATNATSSDDERSTLYMGVAYILGSIAVLWFMGAIVFRKVRF